MRQLSTAIGSGWGARGPYIKLDSLKIILGRGYITNNINYFVIVVCVETTDEATGTSSRILHKLKGIQ